MLVTLIMLRGSNLTSLIVWEENLYAKLVDWELVKSPVASVLFQGWACQAEETFNFKYKKSKRRFENVTEQGTLELWCKKYYFLYL